MVPEQTESQRMSFKSWLRWTGSACLFLAFLRVLSEMTDTFVETAAGTAPDVVTTPLDEPAFAALNLVGIVLLVLSFLVRRPNSRPGRAAEK